MLKVLRDPALQAVAGILSLAIAILALFFVRQETAVPQTFTPRQRLRLAQEYHFRLMRPTWEHGAT